MSRVAHMIWNKLEWKTVQAGRTFVHRRYFYACGRTQRTVIEEELDKTFEGWPEGTRFCKQCERYKK